MSTITVKNLEPSLEEKLRLTAASHGRTMEEEARSILNEHFKESAPVGGIELELPSHAGAPRAATFD
jgi:antitoxin FitA